MSGAFFLGELLLRHLIATVISYGENVVEAEKSIFSAILHLTLYMENDMNK